MVRSSTLGDSTPEDRSARRRPHLNDDVDHLRPVIAPKNSPPAVLDLTRRYNTTAQKLLHLFGAGHHAMSAVPDYLLAEHIKMSRAPELLGALATALESYSHDLQQPPTALNVIHRAYTATMVELENKLRSDRKLLKDMSSDTRNKLAAVSTSPQIDATSILQVGIDMLEWLRQRAHNEIQSDATDFDTLAAAIKDRQDQWTPTEQEEIKKYRQGAIFGPLGVREVRDGLSILNGNLDDAAGRALDAGQTLAIGENHHETTMRDWVSHYMDDHPDSVKFLALEVPTREQPIYDDYLAGRIDRKGFRERMAEDGWYLNDTPESEVSYFNMLDTAARLKKPVRLIDNNIAFLDGDRNYRREAATSGMATEIENAAADYGGPGLALVGSYHTGTKYVEGQSYSMVSIDPAFADEYPSLRPGEIAFPPDNVPYGRNHDDSTLIVKMPQRPAPM